MDQAGRQAGSHGTHHDKHHDAERHINEPVAGEDARVEGGEVQVARREEVADLCVCVVCKCVLCVLSAVCGDMACLPLGLARP